MRMIFFCSIEVLATRNKECMDRRHFLFSWWTCYFHIWKNWLFLLRDAYRWHSNTSNLGSFTFCKWMIFINGKDLKKNKRNMLFCCSSGLWSCLQKVNIRTQYWTYITSFIHLLILLSIFHRIPYIHIFLIRKNPELICMLPCNQWRS